MFAVSAVMSRSGFTLLDLVVELCGRDEGDVYAGCAASYAFSRVCTGVVQGGCSKDLNLAGGSLLVVADAEERPGWRPSGEGRGVAAASALRATRGSS